MATHWSNTLIVLYLFHSLLFKYISGEGALGPIYVIMGTTDVQSTVSLPSFRLTC